MAETSSNPSLRDSRSVDVEQLHRELEQLRQVNHDLEIALQTITEHGDTVEAELHQTNQQLQAEIAERKLAQATLQHILETVSKDKSDLELMLKATVEHGDTVEYQLYTQAVEAMRQSEELFRAISESTPIVMILTQQLNGVISYANSTSSQGLGVDVKQLVGRRLEEFFANPQDYDRLQTLLMEQGSVRNYELQAQRSNGELFWASTSVHPLMLGGSKALLTTMFDISDRVHAETALRRSEEQLRQQAQDLEQRVKQRTAELQQAEAKYRSIFENAAEGIFQTTPDGKYLSANPALAELYGYTSSDELMTCITDAGEQLYVRPRRRDELVAYMRRFNSVTGAESEIYRKDGSRIWIAENIRAIKNEAGEVMYYEGSVWDISDRKSTEAELRQQRQQTELLLLNVLPQPIAERLKRGEKTIADSFTVATVLFADIANFTQLSTLTSPIELIELLNEIFSAFDALVDLHQLEKIKTIGDAYMVVGGVPTFMSNHVAAIADMAIAMHRAIANFRTKDNQPIALRVGIHTGPVIAGIIGNRRFSYDLWGDTVNVASRMESQGEVGRTQVTKVVYERLKPDYEFEPRGAIDVKGKGTMQTYWLLDRIDPQI